MGDSTSSFDVEPGGGTLHYGLPPALDPMDFEERQLSSDMSRILQIHPGDDFAERGQGLPAEPKQENRDNCRFANQSGATQGGGAFGQITDSGFGLPGFKSTFWASAESQLSSSSPYIRPEGRNAPWNQPFTNSPWGNDDSLSSTDLSMDREPSMPFRPQVLSPPSDHFKAGFQGHFKGQGQNFASNHGDLLGMDSATQMRYPYENKLRRYDEQGNEHPTNEHHLHWQHKIQAHTPGSAVQVMEDEIPEKESYTFELDEFGEGPLHLLTAVTDKTTLAKSLHMLQICGVVEQCINLQNKIKQTPLFLTVLQSNIGLMVWLLENGADPNIQGTLYTDRDEYIWRTPLHLAAMNGDRSLQILRMLLTKSSVTNINALSYGDKLTALHLALKNHTATHSCRAVILELIDRGADVTIRDQSSSKTPFMLALETRDLELVNAFLDKFPADGRRAILQEQTRSGDTCLHIAAGLSRIESADKEKLLRYLVINGANGNVMNNVKEFPKDFARKEWDNIRRT